MRLFFALVFTRCFFFFIVSSELFSEAIAFDFKRFDVKCQRRERVSLGLCYPKWGKAWLEKNTSQVTYRWTSESQTLFPPHPHLILKKNNFAFGPEENNIIMADSIVQSKVQNETLNAVCASWIHISVFWLLCKSAPDQWMGFYSKERFYFLKTSV